MSNNRIWEFAILFFLIISGFWLWVYFGSEDIVGFITKYLAALALTNEILAGVFFFFFAAISVLLGPFTSSPLVPLAVIIWGKALTFWILFSGWVVGSMLAYGLGGYFGYPLVSKILSKERADEWRHIVSVKVNFAVAFLFRLALPAETGYIFGLAKYTFWKYLLITIFVEFPTAGIVVFAGEAFLREDFITFAGLIIGIFGVFTAAAYFLRKRTRRMRDLS